MTNECLSFCTTGEGGTLFAQSMEFMSKSPPDEDSAYALMTQAADLGHWKAKRKVLHLEIYLYSFFSVDTNIKY